MGQNKILILEDEAIVAQDLASMLEVNRYEVVGITASGREAVELAKANPPDLIIMDINVQGDLNGIEATLIIQAQRTTPIPVIFLSAFPAKNFPLIHAVYPYSYLTKPVLSDDLLGHVLRALNKQKDKIES